MTTDAVLNEAGERMTYVSSDAEACRWWLENGRRGDYLQSTGEPIESIVDDIIPGEAWTVTPDGSVLATDMEQLERDHARFDGAHALIGYTAHGYCLTCGWDPATA